VLRESFATANGNLGSRLHLQASRASVTESLLTVLKTVERDSLQLQNTLNTVAEVRHDVLNGAMETMTRVAATLQGILSVFAAYLYACGDVTTSSAGVPAKDAALLVHDLEATPQKARTGNNMVESPTPAANDDHFLISVSAVVNAVLSLVDTCIAPLVSLLPVPTFISVRLYAECLQQLCAVQHACGLLRGVVLNSPRYLNCHAPCARLYELVTTAVTEYSQGGAVSYMSWLEQSAVDSILRQQWNSDSKYMRDRKITQGMTALCVSLRSAVWDVYTQVPVLHWGQQQLYYTACSKVCLQMVLTAAVQVCRTYTGIYLCSDISGFDSNSSRAVPAATNVKWVSPSRVRLSQWLRDLNYFIYTIWDTLAWLISIDTTRITTTSEIEVDISKLCEDLAQHRYNVPMDGSGGITISQDQRRALLSSQCYRNQAEITSEVLQVLRYLLLCVYIVTEKDVDALLANLTASGQAVALGAKATLDASDGSGTSGVWEHIEQLAHCLSASADMLSLYEASAVGDALRQADTPPAVHFPVGSLDMTTDVVTGCGLHSFVIPTVDETALQQYRTLLLGATEGTSDNVVAHGADSGAENNVAALKVAAARLAAQGAVAVRRWFSLSIQRPQYLLRLLSSDTKVFANVYSEANEAPGGGASAFMVQMLERRYEVTDAKYPPLTAEETTNAGKIMAYLDTLQRT
jgi:hypothetical protein